MSDVTIDHVYLSRGVVSGWVVIGPRAHRVGHLPWQGWFCDCTRGKRCPHIAKVKELVPVAAVELGARNVEAGITPAPACAVLPAPEPPDRATADSTPNERAPGPAQTPEPPDRASRETTSQFAIARSGATPAQSLGARP